MRIVYWIVAVLLVAAFAFAPRRLLRAAPVVLLAGGILASVVASRFVVHAGARPAAHLPRRRPRVGRPRRRQAQVAYLYDGEPSWPGVWETLFWNTHIDRVYDLGDPVPGPAAAGPRSTIRDDGTLSSRRRSRRTEVRGRLDLDRARRRAQRAESRSRA